MPTLTKPYTKADLKPGMQFRLATPEPELYCNDDYQYGLYIEKSFNEMTKDVGTGKLASGTLDGSKTIKFIGSVDHPAYQDYIVVEATQIGGRLNGHCVPFMITLELLSERFELV